MNKKIKMQVQIMIDVCLTIMLLTSLLLADIVSKYAQRVEDQFLLICQHSGEEAECTYNLSSFSKKSFFFFSIFLITGCTLN